MGNQASAINECFRECFEAGVDAKVDDLRGTFGVRTKEMEKRAVVVMQQWGQQNQDKLESLFEEFDTNHDCKNHVKCST